MAKSDEFYIRFWGVRGSIACPGDDTVRYGGNTSCVEMGCGGHRLIFDGGTGLRALDRSLAGQGPLDADVLFSHTHLDHIWGWPYFSRLKAADTRLTVWAGHLLPDHSIEEVLDGLLSEPFKPVQRGDVEATIDFRDFHAGDTIDPRPGISIRTAALNHPQDATGYRVEFAGRSVCYITDTEHEPGVPNKKILDLMAGADLVIYDSTYTDDELSAHEGWGHSTWQEGARLCDAAGVGTFAVFHHDPDHDDAFMDDVAARVERARPGSVVAREGMVLTP